MKRIRRYCARCPGSIPARRFGAREMTAEREGVGAQIAGLSGWRCSACGAVEMDLDSAMLSALACEAVAHLITRKRARPKAQPPRRKTSGRTAPKTRRKH